MSHFLRFVALLFSRRCHLGGRTATFRDDLSVVFVVLLLFTFSKVYHVPFFPTLQVIFGITIIMSVFEIVPLVGVGVICCVPGVVQASTLFYDSFGCFDNWAGHFAETGVIFLVSCASETLPTRDSQAFCCVPGIVQASTLFNDSFCCFNIWADHFAKSGVIFLVSYGAETLPTRDSQGNCRPVPFIGAECGCLRLYENGHNLVPSREKRHRCISGCRTDVVSCQVRTPPPCGTARPD